jgi:predicted ArsR family transcriptional regulator
VKNDSDESGRLRVPATTAVNSKVLDELVAGGMAEQRTRDRVVQLLLEHGPQTAAQLAQQLSVVPAAIRRHLDTLLAEDRIRRSEKPMVGQRGRGRPAQLFELTESGRAPFPHAYDDLATVALRHLSTYAGSAGIQALAAERVAGLERRCREVVDAAGDDPAARTEALASALTAEGYAATASMIASGGMICQHHCPVAHVAAEFPQLCEAETAVISRLIGSHVQRLATIAHGDGVCTTHIPSQPKNIEIAPTTTRSGRTHA